MGVRGFRKVNRATFLVVDEERVLFLRQTSGGEGWDAEVVPLDQLLAEGADAGVVPESFRDAPGAIMVVPDYWFDTLSFRFDSRKSSLAEAFLERKLRAEHPELPDIQLFFSYSFYQTGQGERMLYTYFLREPVFFALFERLSGWGLAPSRITAAALLWGKRLEQEAEGFKDGGKAFVCVAGQFCFLYFFMEGRFLFSRQINLTGLEAGSTEHLEALAYEINQSIYLFSQKAKIEIDRLYLSAPGELDAPALGEKVGRPVEVFSEPGDSEVDKSGLLGASGLSTDLFSESLCSPDKCPGLAHRLMEQEERWRPVQKVGLVVGVLLLLVLAGEGLVLWKWSKPVRTPGSHPSSKQMEAVQALRRYSEALDLFLAERRRPPVGETIVNVARSLPEAVWIRRMEIETEEQPQVALAGTVRAARHDEFARVLAGLLRNLKRYFRGSRSLALKDIDFDTGGCQQEGDVEACPIALKFSLP